MNITQNVVLASVMMDGAVVCQINSDATSNVAHPAVSALKESASSAQKAPEYATTTVAHLTAFAQNLVVAGSVGTDASSDVHMIGRVFQVVAFVSLGAHLTDLVFLGAVAHQIHRHAGLDAHLVNRAFLDVVAHQIHRHAGLDAHLVNRAFLDAHNSPSPG